MKEFKQKPLIGLEDLGDTKYSLYQLQKIERAIKGGYVGGILGGKSAKESGQVYDAQKKAVEAHKKNGYKHQKNIAGLGGIVSANNPNHVNKKKDECPHCNKIGNYIAMRRWHFDNCKHKNNL